MQSGAGCHKDTTSSPKPGKPLAVTPSPPTSDKKAAEFPPGEFRRISDVYCRGVAGDLLVNLDGVTSSVRNQASGRLRARVSQSHESVESSANGDLTKSRDVRRDSSLWHSRAKVDGGEALSESWSDWRDRGAA